MTLVEQVTEPRFTLAEGPVWDPVRRQVLWVDIPDGRVIVGRLDGAGIEIRIEHRFASFVGAAAFAEDGSLLVAERRCLTHVSLDGTRVSRPLPMADDDDRLNDGTCDAQGRFLVGSLSVAGRHERQILVQVGSRTTILDHDLGLANGMAFSPDGAQLYSVDSIPGRIWHRNYDQESGRVGPRALIVELVDGTPDGMCVDADGNLWVAVWGRGQVRQYTPTGRLLRTIDVPAPHTSSVAFVGPGLDRLLITTARSDLSRADLAAWPLSGSLFIAEPGCLGLPTPFWSGALPA